MVRRESRGRRMVGEVVEADRLRVRDEIPEYASAAGKLADLGACLLVDALEDECAQIVTGTEDPTAPYRASTRLIAA